MTRSYDDLRETQHEIADAIYEHDAQLVVAGMGGGKTAGALTAFDAMVKDGLAFRALVIAPPLVAATVWPAEPPKWGHLAHLTVEHLSGSPDRRLRRLRESNAAILTISCHLTKWLEEVAPSLPPELDTLIVDETSFFKDPRGANSKALRALAGRFDHVYGLTGTPRPNGYEDLWPVMQAMTGDALFPPFDDWRRRNFMPKDPKGYRWEIHDFRARELDKVMAPYISFIDVDLDLPDLNAGRDFDVLVDLPPAAREEYDRMEDKLVAQMLQRIAPELREDEETLVAALSEGVASGKLAQIAQGYLYDEGQPASWMHKAKQEALAETLLQLGSEPVVIWYAFRQDLVLIRRALGKSETAPVPTLGSATSSGRAQQHIAAFSRGEIPVLLAHPASAAHGIDGLQNGGRHHIWFCPTWSAEQYDQAIKRLHRPGQEKPVFSRRIVARNTVDEIKIGRVEGKMEDQAYWSRLIEKLRSER